MSQICLSSFMFHIFSEYFAVIFSRIVCTGSRQHGNVSEPCFPKKDLVGFDSLACGM